MSSSRLCPRPRPSRPRPTRRGMTATALNVWLQTSHPTMPNIVLTETNRDNVIAYITSLKRKP